MLHVGVSLLTPYELLVDTLNPIASATAYYDPSDLSTLFQSGTRAAPGLPVAANNDPVGLMLDKSVNHLDMTQVTAAKRPLWKTLGGFSWLETDGIDDCMQIVTNLSLVYHRVSAIRNIADNISAQIFGGGNTNECLFQNGAGGVGMYNASFNGPVGILPVGTDATITEKWGNPCQIAINNGAYVAAPAMAAIEPGGFTLAGNSVQGAVTTIRFYGAVMKINGWTDPEIAILRALMTNKIPH